MLKALLFLTALAISQGSEIGLTEPHPQCPNSGEWYLPHEFDCSKFYYCQNGEKFIQARDCPPGTEFSATLHVCVHPTLASCALTGEVAPTEAPIETTTEDSCEYLDNGCPADYNIHLLLPHETSCRKFYYCVNGELVLSSCGRGSVFNPSTQTCGLPGSINRVCIEEESSEEVSIEVDSQSSEEIERLPNGCPVDYNIFSYLSHEYYCNRYYQCRFGQLVERRCAAGTHFNPEIQACDFIANAGCTLAGGDAISSEEDEYIPEDVNAITPPSNLLPNGCPVDGSINWLVPNEDCSKFYYCVWGSLVEGVCPGGLHFSIALQRCESPLIAGCKCKNKGCGGDGEDDASTGDNDNASSSEEDLPAGDAPSNPNSEENQPDGDDNNVSSDEQNEDDAIVPPADLLDNGCPVDGSIYWLLPHEDCSKFYYCVWGNLIEASCPSGLSFNPALQRCEFPEIAGCGNGENSPPSREDVSTSSEENDSSNELNQPDDEGNDSSNGGDDNNASSDEQNEDDVAIIPPSNLLDNGCPLDGSIHWLVPHEDCSKFYYCVWGNLIEDSCPAGLQFSLAYQRCDFPEIAGCGNGVVPDESQDLPAGDDPTYPSSGEYIVSSKEQNESEPAGKNDSSSEEDLPAADAPSNQTGDASDEPNNEESEDATATVRPPSDLLNNGCPADGTIHWLVPHEDCSKFYYCVWGNLVEDSCPTGLHFSPTYQRCEFPEVDGCGIGGDDTIPDSSSEETIADASSSEEATPDSNDNASSSEEVAPDSNDNNSSSAENLPASDEQDDSNNDSEENDQDNRCEEECNVLPWAHADCDKYWACNGKSPVLVVCSEGLHFNPSTHTCDFICNAGCIRTHVQTSSSNDGIRIFFPWDRLDSKSLELLKLIQH